MANFLEINAEKIQYAIPQALFFHPLPMALLKFEYQTSLQRQFPPISTLIQSLSGFLDLILNGFGTSSGKTTVHILLSR